MTIELHFLSFAAFVLALAIALIAALHRRPSPDHESDDRPCQCEAFLSEMTATRDELHEVLDQLQGHARRNQVDPLPGMQKYTKRSNSKRKST